MADLINILNHFVQEQPEAVAVRHTNDELTYKQLDEESSKLAHLLQDSKKPMILYGHMSPYMIVGMIGAIKSGCGYVPIDTSVPKERVNMIIDKVQPEIIFNTSDETLEQTNAQVLKVSDIQDSQYPIVFDSQMKQNDVVYTIFTSGSTGEPKGVQIEYASLNEFAEWMVSLNKTGTGKEWLNQYNSLKQFFFCGEILPHKTAKVLVERFPNSMIYNTYGPTEATVAVTSIQITEEILNQYNPLPVGVARPGTKLFATEEGELVIEGQSVSLGYLKNEEKTAAVFNFEDGVRTYHTGDKAKIEDGLWFIQGRIDFQIKLNGYRMELEEIETQLRQSKHVREAVVVPVYKNGKVVHLIGAVVPTESVEDNLAMTTQIKHELKSRLPEYMIPRKFEWMERLPLTLNGKLDRKKIAEVVNG